MEEKRSHARTLLHRHVGRFSWSIFILPLATLGLSLCLDALRFRFDGLTTIGIIVYLFGLVQYVFLLAAISLRFCLHKGSFMRSIAKDAELFFMSTVIMCFASLIMGAHNYGHPHEGNNLSTALRVVFWIYIVLAFAFSIYAHFKIFQGGRLDAADMTPSWLLPSFPSILVGPVAGTIAANLTPAHRFPILIAGLTFQGMGFFMSVFIYSIYLFRLFQNHLPTADARPGLFLAVGPPSFTALGMTKMASAIPPDYGYFAGHPDARNILQTVALFGAIFLWTLAWWFCIIATLSCLVKLRVMKFHLTWYSFVFPNAGMTIAMIEIGRLLSAPSIEWLGDAAGIIITIVWLGVMLAHVLAFWKGRALI